MSSTNYVCEPSNFLVTVSLKLETKMRFSETNANNYRDRSFFVEFIEGNSCNFNFQGLNISQVKDNTR